MVESEKPSFSYEKVTDPIFDFRIDPTVQKASVQINELGKGGNEKVEVES